MRTLKRTLLEAAGVAVVSLLVLLGAQAAFAQVPAGALRYRAELVRSVQAVWGINAPIPAMAAQVHQESAWRPDVCSPYACGLTQFTPDTAKWIGELYGVELGPTDRFNPRWALRALVRYDRHLWERLGTAATECDRWAMTLSAYNGGLGMLNRERKAAADPARWWGEVERVSKRANWAFEENRGYPRRILLNHQAKYALWGRVVCTEETGHGAA